jgi:DNA polymerase-4
LTGTVEKEAPNFDRVILHCDGNAFFASVETVLNPAYRDVPMAVCGAEEDRHGIVLAKNELAKAYGIETAETVWSAKKKCPNLVIAPPHHDQYVLFSERVNEIYGRYTDLVEPFSVDESFLDVTGSQALFGDGKAIADEIRRTVKREIGITVSVGVSFNKMFAKIGSDYKKPDATTVISPENYKEILYPLPVGAMMYVGNRMAAALAACNIRTIGDLAAAGTAFLSNRFGKAGEMISRYARGFDDDPVHGPNERSQPKSVGNGMTFRRDLVKAEEIFVALSSLSEEVAERLRAHGLRACTVSVAVKDTMLHTVSKQGPLPAPSDLAREIADTAFSLTRMLFAIGRPIRALTVTAMNLIPADAGGDQIGFFDSDRDERRERNTRIEGTMDAIRGRFGRGAILAGSVLGSDFGLAPDKTHVRATKGGEEDRKK